MDMINIRCVEGNRSSAHPGTLGCVGKHQHPSNTQKEICNVIMVL